MTCSRALVHAAFASLLATACALDLDRGKEASIPRNECSQNSDCGPGECWQGACVAHDTEISSVLLEIAPPQGEVGASVGGLRFLQNLPPLSRSSSDMVIDLQPATQVVGSLVAANCGEEGPRSFPVEVTFTPREDSYGLPVVTYTAKTRKVTASSSECASALPGLSLVDQFSLWVPSGSYDVYVKPLEAPSGCVVPPQLIRRQSFGNLFKTCLSIPWSEPHKVSVFIPWRADSIGEDSLDGWKLDVVHPITGDVLSPQTVLTEDDRTETAAGPGYRREVYYTAVPEGETVKELVRLTPPAGVVAPVIQADRTGLQVATEEATFPTIGPFLPSVKLGGWVQPEGGVVPPSEGGIPGRAIFTATSLTGIRPGIFASYSTSVVVGDDGALSVELLPGDYRVRVVPEIGTEYAATESPFTAPCQTDAKGCAPRGTGLPQLVRNGLPFTVKPAAALKGGVVDSSSGERVGQVSVDAVPASVSTRSCASEPSNVACAVSPISLLDVALGDQAFVPRSVSGIVESGKFTLTGVDCGECTAKSGALFDVLVKPPQESRRAWGLMPNIQVFSGEKDIGDVELPLPVIHRGFVQIRQAETLVVKRALLRAYVLRDETGTRIADPTGMPSCAMVASSGASVSSTRCIRSALQVAEATSDDQGRFELVLPSRIKEIE